MEFTKFGTYTVVAELGHGGFGRVYHVKNINGQDLALKVFLPESLGSSTLHSAAGRRLFFRVCFDAGGVLGSLGYQPHQAFIWLFYQSKELGTVKRTK